MYTRNAYSMYCITKKPPSIIVLHTNAYCIRRSHEDRLYEEAAKDDAAIQYYSVTLYEEAAKKTAIQYY